MTLATGVGSWPGDDQAAYTEAVRTVLGELPDLPHLPEIPGRGIGADLTGRALAVVADLGADLQPAGWRLTDAPGIDQRRARSQLGQDLDGLEELAQDHVGPFKVQLAGPWTLAATVEKPRGDRVLSDFGARRDLAQALAEGVRTHVADLRRRLPGVTDLLVQLDEPALPAVMAGAVPTASGFHRHRSVDAPAASEALEWVLAAISEAGGVPLVHSCASDVPVDLLRGAGARGVSVDLGAVDSSAYDALATALEADEWVLLGVVPAVDPDPVPSDSSMTERVLRWLDMLGLEPTERLVVTPTCGLAGASPGWARNALTSARATAASLS
ncbi:methionine synthase [Nocardioides sp.]|uniref:methionine synthase n=1 Tax=Nocardioides sp. TaxID=35761 RepID=UPI002733333A|nr:methionine synthase [Nocardioides sp.]MDP3889883.1 methionine synthase [Nocardioides sp.]